MVDSLQLASEGKRRKLNPDNAKSTTEVQKEIYEKRKGKTRGNAGDEARRKSDDVNEENIEFQKINFNIRQGGPDSSTKGRKKKSKEVLLKEALKKREIASSKTEEASEQTWDDAFKRAQGEKVFDDPRRIAKVRLLSSPSLMVHWSVHSSILPSPRSLIYWLCD